MLSVFVTFAFLDHTSLRSRLREIPSFGGLGITNTARKAFTALAIDLNYSHWTHHFYKLSLGLLTSQTEETTHMFWKVHRFDCHRPVFAEFLFFVAASLALALPWLSGFLPSFLSWAPTQELISIGVHKLWPSRHPGQVSRLMTLGTKLPLPWTSSPRAWCRNYKNIRLLNRGNNTEKHSEVKGPEYNCYYYQHNMHLTQFYWNEGENL